MSLHLSVIPESQKITEPGYVDFDTVNDGGKKVIRAQGGFYARGCEWRRKNIKFSGEPSCADFCTWPEMTKSKGDERGIPVQDDELLAQTKKFVEAIHQKNRDLAKNGGQVVERADMYIGGSHLNEAEMPQEVLEKTYKIVSEIPGMETICIEARITDLNDENLDNLDRMAAFSRTKCIVAIGIETTHPDILKDAKKGISPKSIERGFEKIRARKNLIAEAYLLVKPAVMSEDAAVKQAVTDLKALAEIAAKNPSAGKIIVNMAPVSPMEGTGAALNDAYKPSSLWSVIEIIRQVGECDDKLLENLNLFFGLNTEKGAVEKEVTSCPECVDEVKAVIEKFNSSQDPSVISDAPECSCKNEWSEKLGKEKYILGTVHYPFDADNHLAQALYQRQIRGIMNVEQAFPEEMRASQETMEERIHSAGGKYQIVSYNPRNGRITSYFVTQRLPSEKIFEVDVKERGWDRLSMIAPTSDGDVLEGVSMGALPESPPGAARAAVYKIFDIIDEEGLTGLSGVIRLPGLSRIKGIVEGELKREITEEEIIQMGKQFMDAHYERFAEEKKAGIINKSDLNVLVKVGEREFSINGEMDENLSFWGRMPHAKGTIVKSMKSDSESCGLGLWIMREGKNAKKTIDEIQASINSILEQIQIDKI